MVAPQTPNGAPPQGENSYPQVPQYSASGRPNTKADQFAFRLWIVMFLIVILFTLINYLAMQGIFARIINF